MSVISAPNLVKLRTQRHASALRLAVYAPAQIWTAQVNGLQSQGDTTITVKNVSQVRAPAKNYKVLIGASAGSREYGEMRFRSYSVPTLTVSAHSAILPDNAYITVLEWIPPVAIHNTIDATDVVFEDGDIAYTNENVNYIPLARMGAPACAYVDPATNQATINFYGRGTAIAPAATLSSHAWVFGAGSSPATSAIQGTSVAPITVTYTGSGVRYVSYTVTDSNGKTHTRYTPVFIFDRYAGTMPYTNVEISGMQTDVSSGIWTASLKVYTDADYADFPPMGECVLFTEDYYDDVLGSIGNELYRENIKLHGYIRRGTIRKNWQMGYVEFDLVSAPMDAIPQLAGGLETTTGTPADWHVLKNQTYDLAAHHVLTQHTTLSQIADVYLNALPSYTIEFVDLPKTSLGDLLANIIRPIRSRWGFTAQGSLHLEINPQLQSFASRSVAYQITTTFDDFRDELDLGDDTTEKQVGQIVFTGEDANADPLFSLAPAFTYENSVTVDEVVDGIRVADQTESNEFSGLFEGYRNNDLANVVIPWRGNYPMDCFPSEPIAVSIAANQNARGLVWSNQRCWVKQVSCEYRNGAWLVTTTIEKDAYGTPGITDIYAVDTPPIYPVTPPPTPIDFPPVPIPVPPSPTGIPQGKGNLLYVSSSVGVAKCVQAYGTDGTDGDPVWSAVNTGLTTSAEKTIRAFNLDPFSHNGTNFTAAYARNDSGLYRCTGLPDAGVWAPILTNAGMAALIGCAVGDLYWYYTFAPSVLLPGFIGTMATADSHGPGRWTAYFVYSLNYGATWNVDLTKWLAVGASPSLATPNITPSQHLANTYYIFNSNASGNQTTATWGNPGVRVIYSTSLPDFQPYYGHTVFGSGGLTAVASFPYSNSSGVAYANDLKAYIHFATMTDGTPFIQKWNSFGSPVWSSLYTPPAPVADVGDAAMASTIGLVGIFSHMFNENKIVTFGSPSTSHLWTTTNGGSSWTYTTPVVVGTRQSGLTNLFQIPVNSDYFFVVGKKITGSGIATVGMTLDYGATFTDISKQGLADGIDTALGLTDVNEIASAFIIVDYFKV